MTIARDRKAPNTNAEETPYLDGFHPWPTQEADYYREHGYWRGRTFSDFLNDLVEAHPDKLALVCGSERLRYRDLQHRANALAAALRERGIRRRDRVVVQLPNHTAFVITLFACLRIGAVPVLAQPPHRSHEILGIANLCEANAYILPATFEGYDYAELARQGLRESTHVRHVFMWGSHGEFPTLDALELEGQASAPASEHVRSDDVALLLISGGTTGAPKMICRTHDDFLYSASAAAQVAGLEHSSVYLASLPLSHAFCLGAPGMIGALSVGATVVLTTSPRANIVLDLIQRERVTIAAAVPSLAALWLEALKVGSWDVSSLRVLQVGGSGLPEQVASALEAAFKCTLQIVYGMTEGLLNFSALDAPKDAIYQMHVRPLSDADNVRIVDEHDRDVPPGQIGELVVHGPYTHRGYYRNSAQDAVSFTASGEYRSGDLVLRLPSGELIVRGRVKDMIKRAGENVFPPEIEALIGLLPEVRDVAVVGVGDPYLGERTCAAIVPAGDSCPTRRRVNHFLAERGVAPFKYPDQIFELSALPKTNIGKIDKVALRKLIETAATRSGQRS